MRLRTAAMYGATIGAALIPVASASAGAHLVPGATYANAAGKCTSPGAGISCVFKFRASADGRTLQFVGTTAVTGWGCNGGGGEALLGGAKGETIPLIKVLTNGQLSGSATYRGAVISVTGALANGGKTVLVTFHSRSTSGGPVSCKTPAVTLTER